MTGSLVPSLIVARGITITRHRQLPLSGEITVSQGEWVESGQMIGRTTVNGELVIVRVGETLGINGNELARVLRCKEGDSVAKGSVLAQLKGIFGILSSTVCSPVSGLVEFISKMHGHIGIRLPSQEVSLTAYLSGQVNSVVPRQSATICGMVNLVQGAFGIGGEHFGHILILDVEPNQQLTQKHLPSSPAGTILVGGTTPTTDFLRAACDSGVSGIVTGSITDNVLSSFLGYEVGLAVTGDEEIPLSLVITEGFGNIPLSKRVIDVVNDSAGRSASINGTTQVRAGAVRPELLIHNSADLRVPSISNDTLLGSERLKIGQTVRIIREPFFGKIGTIVELPEQAMSLPSGVITKVAHVTIDEQELQTTIPVPRNNLEHI